MAKVELKKPIIDEIKGHLDGAKTVVLVDYLGLTVEQDTKLRRTLRENNVIYKVYKNTMVNFAIQGTEFESLANDLHGATAIAISKEDATAAARAIHNFAKEAPKLELKAGVVESEYYDKEAIQVIATIPSREELLARFLGSLKSPITNFARVVDAIANKKEEEGC